MKKERKSTGRQTLHQIVFCRRGIKKDDALNISRTTAKASSKEERYCQILDRLDKFCLEHELTPSKLSVSYQALDLYLKGKGY